MITNSLIPAASFLPKSLQFPNPWIGHLPFAAWITKEVSPKIFVELGTHTGNSYFSFCQAIMESGTASQCYAVDTWQGDVHAGQYSDEIFTKVNAHNQEHYAGFSRLLRMTFDEANKSFSDESIELLHIDGLHTYEAVRHDFETWLPKLAPGAVVMFHDTNVRERDFGVWQLWEELQTQYPRNIEFVHSHGLGVLQLNNAPGDKILEWLQPNSPEKPKINAYFAALGERQFERYELNEIKNQLTTIKQTLNEREEQIATFAQVSIERDNLRSEIEIIKASRTWRALRYIGSLKKVLLRI
jgi:Methyltransferase domain